MAIIGLDQLHTTLVAHRTQSPGFAPGSRLLLVWAVFVEGHRAWPQRGSRLTQEGTTVSQLGLSGAVGQKVKGANVVQASGQAVQADAAQACPRVERLGAELAAALVDLEAAGDLAVVEGDEAMGGDGHTVSGASQVLEDVPGILQGLFGVAHPLLGAQSGP